MMLAVAVTVRSAQDSPGFAGTDDASSSGSSIFKGHNSPKLWPDNVWDAVYAFPIVRCVCLFADVFCVPSCSAPQNKCTRVWAGVECFNCVSRSSGQRRLFVPF